jgi:predicted ATP-grasp superfamily ATP-dependent carboligase
LTDEPKPCSDIDILVVGPSSRALAESCSRAGRRPLACDVFADVDLRAHCPTRRVPRESYPECVVSALADLSGVPLIWTGGLEHHRDVLAQLGLVRPILGMPLDVLERATNPNEVHRVARQRGVSVPNLRQEGGSIPRLGTWLSKPVRGAGGHGVSVAMPFAPIPGGRYAQEFISGSPCSAIFVRAAGNSRFLGATRQIIGAKWLGTSGFTYCGNIAPLDVDSDLSASLIAAGDALGEGLGLVGLFGIDFILSEGRPWILEVNPRYTAAVEVLELARSESFLTSHFAAFERPDRPPEASPLPPDSPQRVVVGKAILYARTPNRIEAPTPIDEALLAALGVRLADVPAQGEEIPRGSPVTTMLALGPSEDRVLATLERAAPWIERLLFCADFDRDLLHAERSESSFESGGRRFA